MGNEVVMKKIITLILLITFAFAQEEAKVQFVIGKVEYQRQGKGRWFRLVRTSKLLEGDQLRSSLESRAEIKMPDETIIKLKENSLLEIKMIKKVGDKKKANKLFLWAGSIWAKFKKVFADEEENTVSTVTAVAAIRGTEFGMSVNNNGFTVIRLKTGRLEIRTRSRTTNLNSNTTANIDNDGEVDKIPGIRTETQDGVLEDNTGDGEEDKVVHFLEVYQSSINVTNEAEVASGIEISGETKPGSQVQINGQLVTVLDNGFFQHFETTFEGKRRLTVRSINDGQALEKTIEANINISFPELSVDNYQGQIFVNEPVYNLSLQGNDITPGDLLNVYINNRLSSTGLSPLVVQEPVSLTNGRNQIKIEIRDAVGHTAQQNIEIIYDGEAPSVRILSGLDDILPDTPFGDLPPATPDFPYTIVPRPIYGLAIDREPSSGIKELIINGERVTVRPDGSFNYTYFFQRNQLVQQYRELRATGGEIIIPIRIEIEDQAGNRFIDESYNILMRALRTQ